MDRLNTLKEMRLLAADQVKAWRDVQDVAEKREGPVEVIWRVVSADEG